MRVPVHDSNAANPRASVRTTCAYKCVLISVFVRACGYKRVLMACSCLRVLISVFVRAIMTVRACVHQSLIKYP